ncbi:unnamed protein product [Gongylonema pulchrum]|uniref:EXPERA domain-containing protein n=1 Tax=Gongylonema pulchrum TaxID=637853 RepID=A0A183EX18_9BILA|nr:unnamed protein product [Gongylonema pulchrum]
MLQVLQALYYSMCFVCAVMDALREKSDHGPHKKHPSAPSYWRNSKLHQISDFMYFTSVLPVGTVTCILFWGLYVAEPTLVMPEWAEKLIPPFMNHITHTAPIPFILVDTLLTCHQAPSRKLGSVVVVAEVAFYFTVTCILFWGLYVAEPTLVMPEWAEKLIPPFMNHITHTAPIPFILVDTLLTCHQAPSRKLGSVVVVAEVAFYFTVFVAFPFFFLEAVHCLVHQSCNTLNAVKFRNIVFLFLLYIDSKS